MTKVASASGQRTPKMSDFCCIPQLQVGYKRCANAWPAYAPEFVEGLFPEVRLQNSVYSPPVGTGKCGSPAPNILVNTTCCDPG